MTHVFAEDHWIDFGPPAEADATGAVTPALPPAPWEIVQPRSPGWVYAALLLVLLAAVIVAAFALGHLNGALGISATVESVGLPPRLFAVQSVPSP